MGTHFEDAPYEVGYGKPPVHSRYPKGKSGNPRGRPKGSANYLTILRKVFDQKVVVVEGGKRRKITKFEAAATQQLNKAVQGDTRAAQAVFKLAALPGLQAEEKGNFIFIVEG